MPRQPMAEVFGFPIDNFTEQAVQHRSDRLCPYNNKVPNCTKDKAEDPLGVCSVTQDGDVAITCPIRFRQDWKIASDAKAFFFPGNPNVTSLTEVPLRDANGKSAGNIDVVLVAHDGHGRITDFGALEVQAVYISGNIRRPFEHYMADPANRSTMDWSRRSNYPRPDYLSSSRKRLAPQLIYKGGILQTWGKRIAVAVDSGFFGTLPPLRPVPAEEAQVAWIVYDLVRDGLANVYILSRTRTLYTDFETSLNTITKTDAGPVGDFVRVLQDRLDRRVPAAPLNRTIAEPDVTDPDLV